MRLKVLFPPVTHIRKVKIYPRTVRVPGIRILNVTMYFSYLSVSIGPYWAYHAVKLHLPMYAQPQGSVAMALALHHATELRNTQFEECADIMKNLH